MIYKQSKILKRSRPVVEEWIYFRGKFHFVLGLLTTDILRRFRVGFTVNGKREFIPPDQVLPLLFILLFITSSQKLVVSR